MNKLAKVIVVVLFLISVKSYAIVDTLRFWDTTSALVYDSVDYDQYTLRFELGAPGTLTKVRIIFGGGTGTCLFHLYGHEGGTPYLSYLDPKMTSTTLTKSVTGLDTIEVAIPNVYLDNDQFFILITNMTTGMELMRDTVDRGVQCASSSGGDLVYYTALDASSHNFGYAAAVDCIMDFPTLTPALYFTEVTVASGLPDSISNKTMAAADYDEDGYTDLMVSGRLFKNNGDSTFSEQTSTLGLTGTPVSNTFADVDNDGDLDILFLDVNDQSFVYMNNAGTFTRQLISSMPVFVALNALSLADLNNDGFLDLFAGQLASPWPQPSPNYLLYSNGNEGFTDSSYKMNPRYFLNPEYPGNPNRMSRGSSWVDYDDDGDQDLFVTNYRLHPDEFYENNGNGTFTDKCYLKGIDRNNTGYNHGTGVDWADYNNDGTMDLLLCQFAHPRYVTDYDHRGATVYKNLGAPDYDFEDTYNNNGIQLEETRGGGTWGDVNNDGLLDLFMTVYYGCRYVDLYLQKPDHTFELKTWDFGLDKVNSSQDALWLDFDNDGKLDLITGEGGDNSSFRLYHNTGGFTGNYIKIKAKGTTSNKYAVGAKIKVFAGSEIFTREVTLGSGQLMQESFIQHIGLGTIGQIDSVTVQWPGLNGFETFSGATINQTNTYTQGQGVIYYNPEPLGIEEEQKSQVNVYPNPASETVYVQVFTDYSLIMDVFDATGRLVKVLYLSNKVTVWNCKEEVSPGLYYYKIRSSEDGSIQRKGKILVE